jgi:hypothetical protein
VRERGREDAHHTVPDGTAGAAGGAARGVVVREADDDDAVAVDRRHRGHLNADIGRRVLKGVGGGWRVRIERAEVGPREKPK